MKANAPRSSRLDPRSTILHARVVAGSGGGPDKTILNSPRFLEPAGYRAVCAYLRPPGATGFETLRRRARECRAPLVEIDDRGALDWKVFPALLNLCRRERVAVYHGHDYKSNLLGLLLRRFWRMRLVTTVHGWVHHTGRTPLYYKIDRWCLPRYERVLGVSPDLCDAALACGVSPERCVLVENAIDTDHFRRRRTTAEAKRLLGFDPDRFLIGAVGRLSREKGFDVLIRSVDRLLACGQDVGLVIAGEGDEGPALQVLIDELGRGDRIRLLGYRSDTVDLFQALDAFALSSRREGLPNVVLEALALEVPVVATRIAGVPRLIAEGVNGLLVPPGNEGELSAGLERLIKDEELRHQLARAGRETIEARYSFHKRMDAVRSIYDMLLGSSGE